MMHVFNQVKPDDMRHSPRCLPPSLSTFVPPLSVHALTSSALCQVSRCVTGPLAFKRPVVDYREEHVWRLQEVQQQHRRRDRPLLYTGGNAARLLSLDIRVLMQRASGSRHTRWVSVIAAFLKEHTSCKIFFLCNYVCVFFIIACLSMSRFTAVM